MALDWAAYRSARGSGRARGGFAKRPFPEHRSWLEMVTSPLPDIPWPYSQSEAQAITAVLPQDTRRRAIESVAYAARLYMHAALRGHPRRPSPRKEIDRLRRALTALCDAVMDLSPDARAYLEARLRAVRLPDQEPFTVDSLRYALDKFDFENRIGLENLPPAVRGGPRSRDHETRLIVRLKEAFRVANGGKLPKRGWPDFLAKCFTPLFDFGLPHREQKAWQDVLRKRRNNSRKKG